MLCQAVTGNYQLSDWARNEWWEASVLFGCSNAFVLF